MYGRWSNKGGGDWAAEKEACVSPVRKADAPGTAGAGAREGKAPSAATPDPQLPLPPRFNR